MKPVSPRRSTLELRKVFAWLTRPETPKWFLVSAALLVLGSAWLFLGILEDVVTGDPLVQVDVLVHDTVQTLRTAGADRFFAAVTELRDLQVVGPSSSLSWAGFSATASGSLRPIGLLRSAWPKPW